MRRATVKKRIPYPKGLMRPPLLFWEYLEYKKGTKRVSKKNAINPLYFVPIARPHKIEETIKYFN